MDEAERLQRRLRYGQAILLGVTFKQAPPPYRGPCDLWEYYLPQWAWKHGGRSGGGYSPLHIAVDIALRKLGVIE